MSIKLVATADITDITGLQTALDSKQIKLKSGGSNVTIGTDGTLSVTGSGATSYTLPQASSTVLGGVKIGSGINISPDGTISVTSTGGGSAEGQLINLPDQSWYKIIQPTNFNKTYVNGTTQGRYFIGGYRDNTGVNFSTEREDKVFTIAAYNILKPNGSREFLNEAAWDFTVETHYDNSGFQPYGDFEWHQRMYDSKGFEHRWHSVYGNKTTGKARHDFEGNGFSFMSTINGTPQNFANLEPMNDDGDGTGAFAQLTLLAYSKANSGGKIKFNHNGIMSSIEGNNGSISINSLAGLSASFDRMGNTFLGYKTGSTIFLGTEYDYRNIDATKKLQVRGDALIEGGLYLISPNGTKYKISVSDAGTITAVKVV